MSISILIKKKLYEHLLKILELCPIDLLILSLHLMMSLVRLQLVLVGRTAEVRLRYYPVVSAQWDERVKKTLALALCTSITRRFRSSISLSFAAI